MDHRSFLSIGKIIPYYKFARTLAFPSLFRIVVVLFIVTLVGCMLAFTFHNQAWETVAQGLAFGFFVLFVPTILADTVSSRVLVRGDPLFYLRRCLALSLFSCTVWTVILALGALGGNLTNIDFPQQPFYLALFTVLPLRSLATLSMSSTRMPNKVLFSFSQPLASSFAATMLFGLSVPLLAKGFFAAGALSLVSVVSLLVLVENKGKRMVRASPLRVFRAFLVDWLNRKNEMFERFLEEIGTESKVEVTMVQFNSRSDGQPKGLFVVSNFHPGPFLNVGSSVLPYMIKKSFEGDGNLVAAVPHGVSGHENNLVSQTQNAKVLSAIRSLLGTSDYGDKGSSFGRFEVGSAKVGAQVFGNCLLLTLTQSPKEMEDIPSKLGRELTQLAKKRFKHVAIIDSHNCIDDVKMFTDIEIEDLRLAASQAIEYSAKSKTVSLEMGAARSAFEGLGPEEGCGPGGISAFIFKTSDHLTAYVTFDANNMLLGLRERILSSLESIGVDDGEIMTTDTHIVNGLVPARLGYYPLGEAVDQEILVELVRKTVERAKDNLEGVSVSCSSGSVEVKSLGSESLESLTVFMYRMAKLVAAYMSIFFLISNVIGILLG